MQTLKQITVTILILSAILAVVACGAAAEAAQPAATVTIKAHDYAFEAPAQIEAGLVSITLVNEGQEPHHVQLARLNDGVTLAQLQAALQQGPAAAFPLVTWAGGPGALPPGQWQQVTVELTPGQYVLLCFIPSPDGLPHTAKGMVGALEVVGSAANAVGQPPQADVTVNMRDFIFVLPSEVEAGPQVWQINNQGVQPHELSLIRLAEGKTMKDVATWMQTPHGAPPFENAGGLVGIDPGESGWLHLDLQPGNYVALCHIPEPLSGQPHTELGMVRPFSVK